MRLADPWLLLSALLLLPLLVWQLQASKLRFSSITRLSRGAQSHKVLARRLLDWVPLLILVALVIALARPQLGKRYSEVVTEGVDIILALDTSGSMEALDFEVEGKRVTRLDVVKREVMEFIKKRSSDRLGMVVFGAEAYTQCPLTLDHDILLTFADELYIGMAGDATAIGSAIATGVKRLKDLKAKSKVMVLLTDGRHNQGRLTPEKAAEVAATFGIKIYTIGVGTRGKAPFLARGLFGKRLVYQEVDLDEPTLEAIANTTGGEYFRATDADELKQIYAEIDQLETSEAKVKEYAEYHEIFHWFALPALMMLFLQMILGQTWLRTLP